MATLNSWQRIDRVIPGKPFGDGSEGDYNSGTIPSITYRSCSGSSGSNTLSLTSDGFSNGDIILIHQTRGTGAGQWEINKITAGGGSSSLTLAEPLQYDYSDSGADQAQAVKIHLYHNVTLPSDGTWTVTSWNQDTGGIFVIAAEGTAEIDGVIDADGNLGTDNDGDGDNVPGGSGIGYRGGTSRNNQAQGYAGEGTQGDIIAQSSANGTGGGGGKANSSSDSGGAGGGGGHASTGGSGGGKGSYTAGDGGGTGGATDLTTMIMGGGGGGGGMDQNAAGGTGGGGGGIVLIISKTLNLSGNIYARGAAGTDGAGYVGGGGGAGGSILFVTEDATLGSSLAVATGGTGASGSYGNGGDGGTGRIALHYSSSYSGSTNPGATVVNDPTLVETSNVAFLLNFI